MENLEYLIKDLFLFDSLSADQIRLVTRFCSQKKVSKGEQLFAEGQKATAFFAIISGKAKIYKLSSEGNEHILRINTSGDLIAEAAIFDCETYPAYCQTLEETELIRIPKDDFVSLILDHSEIALKIIHAYSKRMRYFVNLVEELSMHDIKSRLAKYLIENAVTQEEQKIINLSIAKKELAAILGTIPETLSRTLGYFKREKMIEERENIIVLLNPSGLKSLI